MFTGIVQEKGKILSFGPGEKAWNLRVDCRRMQKDVGLGDSIAVNGCCLTVVAFDGVSLSFELLEETVRLTSFHSLSPGDFVNLETSLLFNGKIGGHFVTGHIDGVGVVLERELRGLDTWLRVMPPAAFMRYLIHKGSIAIDGVSLTVAEVEDDAFGVWLIPHTLEMTNLGVLQPGGKVNLEFDLLGKYVERLAAFPPQSGVS